MHKISGVFSPPICVVFSSTGWRPEGLMSWQFVLRPLTSFLVNAIETTFLNQSGPNLHEVFMGTRSQMSSIMSKIRPSNSRVIAPEILKILVLNLVSAIETTFLNQSGPKLHKVFIGTGSQMSSIMRKSA